MPSSNRPNGRTSAVITAETDRHPLPVITVFACLSFGQSVCIIGRTRRRLKQTNKQKTIKNESVSLRQRSMNIRGFETGDFRVWEDDHRRASVRVDTLTDGGGNGRFYSSKSGRLFAFGLRTALEFRRFLSNTLARR